MKLNNILAMTDIVVALLTAGNASATLYSFDLKGRNPDLSAFPGEAAPEPCTLLLGGGALAGLASLRKKRLSAWHSRA